MRKLAVPPLVVALAGLLGLTAAFSQTKTERAKAAPKAPAKAAAKGPPPAVAPSESQSAVEAAIRQSADDFAAAYNAHDAQAIAAGFTADGEFVEEGANTVRGRAQIAAHFVGLFETIPDARIQCRVESVRVVAPHVAIEDGSVEAVPFPGAPAETSRYVAVHVREGDRWLIARVRDHRAESVLPTHRERLEPLAWLVGEWVDESPDTLIETRCQWADNGNFLLQEFTAQIGGRAAMRGSTRIGWDPLTRQVRSWTFDSAGGFSEALWTPAGDEWIIKSKGVTADGEISSATNIIRLIDPQTMTWESRDRVAGDTAADDIPPLVVKRRAPSPGK